MPDDPPRAIGAGPVDQLIQQLAVRVQASQFAGPIPPPDMLAGYERIFPGCAERIVAMAERQAEHRQGMEREALSANTRRETRGQWFGFVISVLAIAAGTYLIAIGKSTSGLAVILGDLAALVGVFIYGRWQQERERREVAPPAPAPAPRQS